jgi:nucleoside phosphorylase
MESPPLDVREYTVGWLCALPIELAAAQLLLDETHKDLPYDPNDGTKYTLGSIGNHNVVIGCLSAGQLGIGSAATVATRMHAKFPNLRFGLMVGVGGGVPGKEDVRLGDVVVSQPSAGHGGVIQYDFGKSVPGGFVHTGFLNAPPQSLLQALANLQARHLRDDNNVSTYLAVIERKTNFRRPNSESDILFQPTYDHIKGEKTCRNCDTSETVDREPRGHSHVAVHYGTIASGNRVIKNARVRDLMSSKFGGVLCFEMEAAGLMNNWLCLVIRGICDYADSHKNKEWQPYAAATAAAYAKEVLSVTPAVEMATTRTVNEAVMSVR